MSSLGRPKKYTPEFIDKEAVALVEYAKDAAVPFKQEFAIKRGYYSQLISRFAKENDSFCEALKVMEDIQLIKLVKGMLSKRLNVSATIFTLKNVAGWRDNQKVELSGGIGGGETKIYIVTNQDSKKETDVGITHNPSRIPKEICI